MGRAGPKWFQFVEESREWEDFYRSRWRFDKVVRSTHGVNCSMSCSWLVYVKDGIVVWELQAIDYPLINPDVPPHEPRGCQRGISSSWYLYSPTRVKYPYVRRALWDMYSEARRRGLDPVEAWASIVEDPEKSMRYKRARGKGGWKRVTWDEALELVAGALVYTIKKYGPDRIAGFSPIPAMSMVSFISGMRFVSLIGGAILSFYEWYNDLPLASPQMYGEQTDVHESADWYNATYWIIAGTSLPTTRTADAHFMSEVRYNGTKVVIVSPDYYDHVKFADVWIPIKPGTGAAFALAMAHVILKEFYFDRKVDYFIDYVKRYTNLPFLVVLEKRGNYYVPGRMLRASQVERYAREENGEWKLLVLDSKSMDLRMPPGSIGFRWDSKPGRWNLKMEDAVTGEPIDPLLTLLGFEDERVPVAFPNLDDVFAIDPSEWGREPRPAGIVIREVPAKRVRTIDGEVLVTTVFDLLAAQLGVRREGLGGDYPASYDDPKPFTPAWQERFTGVDRSLVIKIAREFAENAEKTKGRSLIIMGPGVQHWYHQDLHYRAYILLVVLTGSVGRNGGGWCHYVGTEKLRTLAPVVTMAFGLDWTGPPRFMNSTLYWYIHTGQWKFDRLTLDTQWAPYASERARRYRHPADFFAMAVRVGWVPFYPTFDRNPIEIVDEALKAGARSDEDVVRYVVKQLREGRLRFAIEDPDVPQNSPKILFVWRGNLIGTSMRGHYHFLKTVLGTHHNILGEEQAKDLVKEIVWRPTPEGKLDLLVTIEFRMSSSANYADVLLPAAHWYEKYDITCGDLHTFIHPFTPATDPYWEARHEWDIFKDLARKFSELASKHLPRPVKDLVVHAFLHDTPQELAQPYGDIADWKYGDIEPIPGKTMPIMLVVERDYTKIYDMYIKLGPRPRERFGAKGVFFPLGEVYDRLREDPLVGEVAGYPSLENPVAVAEVILRLAPETDGEVSYMAWKALETRVGLKLADIVEHRRHERYDYNDIIAQPRRVMSSPMWSGIEAPGRTYSPYTLNIERLVPFRTLSGRQEVYIDHGVFRDFGEALPTSKPPIDHVAIGDVPRDLGVGKLFRLLTPHPKWGIHSTFQDNLRMLALFRGGPHVYLNPADAAELGIRDNDWVEIFTIHGIAVARAVTSPRVPRGAAIMYHGQERNVNVPASKLAIEKGKSDILGGNNNAFTRILPKVLWVVGGYAQLSYFLNYHGTSPSERDIIAVVRKMPLKPGEKPLYPAPGRAVQLHVGR